MSRTSNKLLRNAPTEWRVESKGMSRRDTITGGNMGDGTNGLFYKSGKMVHCGGRLLFKIFRHP